MIVAAIENNIDTLENIASELRAVLEALADSQNLSFRQSLCLAALCLERRPDVVLDLGTGKGNSAAVFSVAGKHLGRSRTRFDRPYFRHAKSLESRGRTEIGSGYRQTRGASCRRFDRIRFLSRSRSGAVGCGILGRPPDLPSPIPC